MTINSAFPVLDGIDPSWADVIVRISPVGAPLIEMADIKSISSDSSVDVGEKRGASGGRVMGRTTGQSKHGASMTLYYSGFVKFLDGLALVAPTRGSQKVLRFVHFGIQLQWTPRGSSEIFERRIKGCFYAGETIAASEGTDAQTVDVALNPLEVVNVRNGVELVIL